MTKDKYPIKWDSTNALRQRTRLTLKLQTGYSLFTAGREPLATATLMPDGETLDITLFVGNVEKAFAARKAKAT